MLENPGYVYLVQAVGTDRYKIGRTKDPEGRIETLEQQSPFPLKLTALLHTNDCVVYEARLHKIASKYRRRGEWFELPSWWLEHLEDWFYNSKCLKYTEVGSAIRVVRCVPQGTPSKTVAKPVSKTHLLEFALVLPSNYEQIERAVCLLGHYSQGAIPKSKKIRSQLIDLIGAYPTDKVQAASWKARLKQAAKDLKRNSIAAS